MTNASRKEKLSERMEIRLGYEEKQGFVDACDVQGDTPSSALRRFIRGYTRRADGELMGEANRRLMRRYGWGLAAVGAVAAVGASVLFAGLLKRTPDRFMSAGAFAAVDRDGDGVLRADELGAKAEDIMRVLDINGEPGIQPVEAITRGRMSYQIADRMEVDLADGDTPAVTGKPAGNVTPLRLVEFDLTDPERTTVYVAQGDGSSRPDRAVLWARGAARPSLVIGNAEVALAKD